MRTSAQFALCFLVLNNQNHKACQCRQRFVHCHNLVLDVCRHFFSSLSFLSVLIFTLNWRLIKKTVFTQMNRWTPISLQQHLKNNQQEQDVPVLWFEWYCKCCEQICAFILFKTFFPLYVIVVYYACECNLLDESLQMY